MTRGFVTIATGKEYYYILARNLLRSYRLWSRQDTPFAIICEEENEFTKEFDKAILLENPSRSYIDKLQLYRYLPYDETIFIDADSLAYGDLNAWWDVFSQGTDFAGFGLVRDLKDNIGWVDPKKTGEFQDQITYMPDIQGGVYYLRRSETCQRVFELANYFKDHYFEYGFLRYTEAPADEPVLSLAMAVQQCRTIRNMPKTGVSYVCTMPHFWNLKSNIMTPYVSYRSNMNWFSADLIHWGNRNTRYFQYRFDAANLSNYIENPKSILRPVLYTAKLKKVALFFSDFRFLPERVRGHLSFLK